MRSAVRALGRPSLIGLTVMLALAGCASPKYHRGPIIPIRSAALPERPVIVTVNPASQHRRRIHKPAPKIAPAPQHYLSVPGGVAPAPASPSDGKKTVAGLWHVRWDKDDCYVELTMPTDNVSAKAHPMACNGGPIASVSSWRFDGKELLLLETDGRNAASLRPTASGGFKGSVAGNGETLQLDRE